MLSGSLEQDKLFSAGDKALVRINYQDGEILNVSMIDHYRAPWELLLFFRIHGAVMSYSESLLYAGYQHLNLTQIFMASIFIGASGAIMDLSVDITSAVFPPHGDWLFWAGDSGALYRSVCRNAFGQF